MPTGYTAGVQDGTITDFRTFALRCARAFDATIMQRVEPFYVKNVEEARARVAELSAMTDAEAEAAHQRALNHYVERQYQNDVEQARYRVMIESVEAWTPPTPDHQGLKDFMLKQLRESKAFDDYAPKEPVCMTGRAWLAREISLAARHLEQAEQSLADEERRAAESIAWVRALYDSLTPEPSRVA
jgi:hypothetical protein